MDEKARAEYHALVASLFWRSGDIQPIARSAALRMDMINWDDRAFSVWQDVLSQAVERDRFDALHASILAMVAALDARQKLAELRARMADALEAPAATARFASLAGAGPAEWYCAPQPHLARLVGPQRMRAVFDRVDLRSFLDSMDHGLTALFVNGQSGAGRSYSWQLLRHVAAARGHRSVWIDIKRRWGPPPAPPCTARGLMSVIVSLLEIPVDLGSTSTTQPDTEPRLLADKLIAAWPPPRTPAGGRFWIMIDGLDHGNVSPWAVDLVEQLLQAADDSEFPGIQPQFLVTGYDGTLEQVLVSAAGEQIQAIGRPDVEQFFRDTASHLGQPVDETFITSLVDRVYDGLSATPDLAALNRSSAELARNVLARAG
jgi:hypothetical protein